MKSAAYLLNQRDGFRKIKMQANLAAFANLMTAVVVEAVAVPV